LTAAEALAARSAARLFGSAIRALGNPNDPQAAFASSFLGDLLPCDDHAAVADTPRGSNRLHGGTHAR
jgi:hypothetical protein